MMRTLKIAGLMTVLSGITGCQAQPAQTPSDLRLVSEGRVIAQGSCASCHAISPASTLSPNPDAPAFASIVNQQGLTKDTLATWLHDAHNYPGEMAFELDTAKVDRLVEYMLTLRDPKYTPPAT